MLKPETEANTKASHGENIAKKINVKDMAITRNISGTTKIFAIGAIVDKELKYFAIRGALPSQAQNETAAVRMTYSLSLFLSKYSTGKKLRILRSTLGVKYIIVATVKKDN